MNRRQLFAALASTAVAPGELWTPARTIFLPPRAGWVYTPLLDLLREHAERVRPAPVRVEYRQGNFPYRADSDDALIVRVVESMGRVLIDIPREISRSRERYIRQTIHGWNHIGPCTLTSLMPGFAESSIEEN